jgi:hypothetical protein
MPLKTKPTAGREKLDRLDGSHNPVLSPQFQRAADRLLAARDGGIRLWAGQLQDPIELDISPAGVARVFQDFDRTADFGLLRERPDQFTEPRVAGHLLIEVGEERCGAALAQVGREAGHKIGRRPGIAGVGEGREKQRGDQADSGPHLTSGNCR